MSVPSSSVWLMYAAVAPFCPAAPPEAEFNFTLPDPGSAVVIEELNV